MKDLLVAALNDDPFFTELDEDVPNFFGDHDDSEYISFGRMKTFESLMNSTPYNMVVNDSASLQKQGACP